MFHKLQPKDIIALRKGHRIPFGEEFNQDPWVLQEPPLPTSNKAAISLPDLYSGVPSWKFWKFFNCWPGTRNALSQLKLLMEQSGFTEGFLACPVLFTRPSPSASYLMILSCPGEVHTGQVRRCFPLRQPILTSSPAGTDKGQGPRELRLQPGLSQSLFWMCPPHFCCVINYHNSYYRSSLITAYLLAIVLSMLHRLAYALPAKAL